MGGGVLRRMEEDKRPGGKEEWEERKEGPKLGE